MCETTKNHDDLLFTLLQECKTLPVFLDDIFGFLQRRTDFYHVADTANAPVGLPEGLAEQLVRHTFHKWKPKPETVHKETPTAIPLPQKSPQEGFTTSESYNGAVFPNYSWSQTISDVDIIVKVPKNTTKKNLVVNILPNRMSVEHDGRMLLEGQLCQKCKQNDAIWSLDNGKLEIHLEKCREMWWDCLLQSEPRLDLAKIDCSRPYEDLPEEAQAKIDELQWNQERKRQGLPTSDEIVKEEMLKKAWTAEGSPFKGPFDPNSVVFE